jgi:hypothetical protein
MPLRDGLVMMVAVSIAVTLRLPLVTLYAVLPVGVIAIAATADSTTRSSTTAGACWRDPYHGGGPEGLGVCHISLIVRPVVVVALM